MGGVAVIRKTGAVASVEDSVGVVGDGAVVAISGFNMATTPEYLVIELGRRYRTTGHPKGIFIVADALPAIPGRALDIVAKDIHESKDDDFVKGISVPFFGFSPWLQKLVVENRLEAYSWPMGVAAYWFREIASGRPGVLSKIGIDTAIDPRRGGGKLNERAAKANTCKVKRIVVDGQDYLLYEAPKPTVAMIRASTADPRGNLSMEEEAIRGTVLSIAQATKAHPEPGVVLAQVRRVSKNQCPPREVEIPGPLVDQIVVSPKRYHWRAGTTANGFGSLSKPGGEPQTPNEETDPARLAIARRVLVELLEVAGRKGSPAIVNLGIGIPALVSRLAVEEGVSDYVITVLESGQWGGVALPGVDFGVALNPFALSTMPDMFSNFEGGTIDAASLGFLQIGRNGDVNPSMLPGRVYGPGGFPVIAGGSPRIYFAGTFTAGGNQSRVQDGRLQIPRGGTTKKFVSRVYKSFFSGSQALKFGKEVLYITERAVFRLEAEGLSLAEVAPGVDIDRDILGSMEFRPAVGKRLKTMDEALFGIRPMGLSKTLRST